MISGTRRPLAFGDHLIFAIVLGLWGAFIAYFAMSTHPMHLAKDFSYPWRAARILLDGNNPYQVIQPTGLYPFNARFYYPLPAAILAIPFASLRPAVAGALFFGLSSALLAFAILRDCPHRLPIFLSAPFVHAATLGQWSPILVAAALMPSLQFVLAAKPTVGLAAWAYRPSWRGIIGCGVLLAISLIVFPRWPIEWRAAMPTGVKYQGPATTLMGAFLLLGFLRWRRREGRLFVALSLVPQLPVFYDQLLLWLVPSTLWRTLALSACSWIGYLAWFPHRASAGQNALAFPWVVFTIYAPALVFLLMLPKREEPSDPAAAGATSAGATSAEPPLPTPAPLSS